MKELEKNLKSLKRETAPFKQAPEPKKNEKTTWLEPSLVAEIKFLEWTGDHLLRQASFKGLRTDKDPRNVKKEIADDERQLDKPPEGAKSPSNDLEKPMKENGNSIIIEGIRITSPDKVIFSDPEIKKRMWCGIMQRYRSA